MSGKERILNKLIAVLLTAIVAVEIGLTLKIRQIDAETETVRATMERAQARIEEYFASLPAQDKPVVISVAPEVMVAEGWNG